MEQTQLPFRPRVTDLLVIEPGKNMIPLAENRCFRGGKYRE
jgi:hypothetical protein